MQADQLNSFADVLAAKFAEQVKGLLPQPTQLMDEDLRGQNGDDADGADDTEDVLEWTSIIPTRLVEATTEDGKKLVRLCQKAPAIQDLKAWQESIDHYTGVPEVPHPRKHRVDQQLYQIDIKITNVLNLLVRHFETREPSTLGAVAAWARSAQQDVREQRRHLLAGRQAWKLDPRQDDVRPKPLSPEEDKKIKRYSGKGVGGKGYGKGGPQQQWANSNWATSSDRSSSYSGAPRPNYYRGRSRSRDWGKGHGKGGGKGRDQK